MAIRMDYLNYGKQEPHERIFGKQKSSGLENESIKIKSYEKPFPHLIVEDFYNEKELELIWEELNFYTKPGKLLEAKDYGGVEGRTNAKALALDSLYLNHESNDQANYRNISNILTVNRKVFRSGILKTYASIHECCNLQYNSDITKVRYYHDGEYYEPHRDSSFQTLAFSYFYKEPKRFEGGELYFPEHNYNYSCNNNSIIIFPGWVQHAVNKVKIKESDYYAGFGRYAITSFVFTGHHKKQ
jgi:hypothetical protein